MFSRFGRRHGVPSEAREALALEKGERVLAASAVADDGWVVGTDRALHLPSGERIPWEQVEHAEWDRDTELLHVTRSASFGEPIPRTDVRPLDTDRLLQLIRERVTASVVVSRQLPIEGKLGVRVTGRRSPAGPRTDELTWSVAFDEGLDPSDPEVLNAAQQALDTVREQVEP